VKTDVIPVDGKTSRGMLLRGAVRPDRRLNGAITTNEKSIACCMVAAIGETNRPIPTASVFDSWQIEFTTDADEKSR
jgi:hypothetical protein